VFLNGCVCVCLQAWVHVDPEREGCAHFLSLRSSSALCRRSVPPDVRLLWAPDPAAPRKTYFLLFAHTRLMFPITVWLDGIPQLRQHVCKSRILKCHGNLGEFIISKNSRALRESHYGFWDDLEQTAKKHFLDKDFFFFFFLVFFLCKNI